VEEQEQVIGRTKHSDIELDEKAPNSHVAVNQVEDEDGNGLEIVRNNLSFGDALGKQGTFFMSYARDPRITEVMLRRMFIGEPEGNHDRILDFSEALTGCNFSRRRACSWTTASTTRTDTCARTRTSSRISRRSICRRARRSSRTERTYPLPHNAEDVTAAQARYEGALRREQ